MGQIYRFLGMSVGVHRPRPRRYAAAGGLSLRHHLRHQQRARLRLSARQHEVPAGGDGPPAVPLTRSSTRSTSILIDEARTPLIISGPTEDNSELYIQVDKLIPALEPDDYEKDEKQQTVTLTETGQEKIEELLREQRPAGRRRRSTTSTTSSLVHHVNQALRAHKLFARDTDYIVKDDKIIIIDEFTGRMMEGRRYSEGLHQALEAKEGVTVQNENQTLASITFQNYFRLYPKLAGMTGTAMTEAEEFGEIYKLDVIEIPTNVPVRRDDNDDEVYRTDAREISTRSSSRSSSAASGSSRSWSARSASRNPRRWRRCSRSTRSRTTC